MELINAQPTQMGIAQQPTIGSLIQQGAQTRQLQTETQGLQTQQAMQQAQMQRAMRARQVVASAVDPQSGQLDPARAVNGLYQAGLSDEAQQLQDHLSKQNLQSAQAEMYRAHGGYFDQGGAQGVNSQSKIQQLTIQNHAALLKNIATEAQDAFKDPNSPEAAAYHESMKPILKGLGAPDEIVNMPYDAVKTPMLYKAMAAGSQAHLDAIKQQQADEAAKKNYFDEQYKQALLDIQKQKVGLQSKKISMSGANPNDPLVKQAQTEIKSLLESRSGVEAEQVKKANAAMHARAGLLQARDPNTGIIDPDKIPSSVYEELATSMASMMGGSGQGSDAQRKGLQQATLKGDFNKARSYFSGKPFAATTPDFLNYVAEQIDRQGSTADNIVNGAITKLKQKYMSRGMPEATADAVVSNPHMTYKDFSDQNGLPYYTPTVPKNMQKQATPQPHPQDNAAVQWAKSHVNDPRAAKILQLNGVK